MMYDFKEIEDSALKLDEKRRAELAKRLIESLDEYTEQETEEAWIEEINRRKEEIKSGKVDPIPGEEVHQMARRKIKK